MPSVEDAVAVSDAAGKECADSDGDESDDAADGEDDDDDRDDTMPSSDDADDVGEVSAYVDRGPSATV